MSTLDSMTRRRAASATRDSDVQHADWPVATLALLADHERLAATHTPEQINQPLFALIRARKAINDARIMVNAAKVHSSDERVRERLTTLSRDLAVISERFPLTIADYGLRPAVQTVRDPEEPKPFGKGFDALK